MKKIVKATATIMQAVRATSTPMTDFTPCRKVRARQIATLQSTFSQKGSPRGPKTSNCKVRHTRNSRTEAPSILERKKNQAPVL